MISKAGGCFYGTHWVAWQQSGYVIRIGCYKQNITRAPKTYPMSLGIRFENAIYTCNCLKKTTYFALDFKAFLY